MDKTIKQKAQELYPVEQKANEYTAFIEGAEYGYKRAVQFVTDLLVSAYEKGLLTEEELLKVFKAMRNEINN